MSYLRSISIARQLRYSLLIAVSVSLLITATILVYISYHFQLDNVLALQDTITDSTAEDVSAYIEDLHSNLSLLARIPGLSTWDTDSHLHLLEGVIRHNSAYENVAILDSDQRIIAALSAYGSAFPDDLNLSRAFDSAFRRGEEFIGQVEYDEFTRTPYAIFAVPIRNREDEVDGILLAQVNLQYLDFVVSSAQVGKTGYVYIVDQRMMIIAEKEYPLSANPNRSIRDNEAVSDWILSHPENSIPRAYEGLHGIQVFGNIKDLAGVGWHLISELPTQEVYGPLREMLLVMGIGLFFAVLVALAVSFILLRQVIAPLEHLTKIAGQISEGHRDVVVEIRRDNEFGILAKAFNKMVAQLNHTIGTLLEDIIERKKIEAELGESERKYRQLVNLAQEGIWVTDSEGMTTFVNPSMAKMLGYSEDEMLGRSIFDFTDEAALLVAQDYMERRRQGIVEQLDLNLRHKSGIWIYVSVEMASIYDEDGNYSGSIAGIMDMSARKMAEQQQFQLELEKERTQILSSFITQATHEFRTPLSTINSSLYLLDIAGAKQQQQRHIVKIKDRVKEISELVNALSTLTTLESTTKFSFINLDLNETIRGIMLSKQDILDQRRLSLALNLELDERVQGETQYLPEAVECLVDNAIRFTPDGGSITLATLRLDYEALVQITDTGVGIAAEDLPRIFERFFRIDKQGTTRGMGLGLPIAERIIELHGGRVSATSEIGKGSTFTIYLPLERQEVLLT